MKRHLAAILYADVAGYSRLTGADEEATHHKLNAALNLLTDVINQHAGNKLHEAGDAILADFPSVSAAVDAAVEFQTLMFDKNATEPEGHRLTFRVGLNIGDVMRDRGDIYGDDVNLTARIQDLAEPGGICVSGAVYEQAHGKLPYAFDDLGHRKLKNIEKSVRVFALQLFDSSRRKQGLFVKTLESDNRPLITGGCMCGLVRYQTRGEQLGTAYCHCRMCQQFAGAPVSVGTGFRQEEFEVLQGQPTIYASSAIAERAFCPECGSSLWTRWHNSGWFYVKTLSLDHPEEFPPTLHFCIESQMPWLDINDGLTRLRCEDSPELIDAWDKAGISSADPPRSISVAGRVRATDKEQ